MCGVIGLIGNRVAERLGYGLSFLQHRGHDSTGIATMVGKKMLIEKGLGRADSFFVKERLSELEGEAGVGHVRYATSGNSQVLSEIQPYYINQPFGMAMVHNGNLVNQTDLRQWLDDGTHRHINSDCDSELLINLYAHLLGEISTQVKFSSDILFLAVEKLMSLCQGSYSVVILIAGHGLLAFRDPNAIRPLLIGNNNKEWLVASESVVFEALSFKRYRDIQPGEAVFIDLKGVEYKRQCAPITQTRPCIFEYIYIARPDSVLDGVSVYQSRLNMGKKLAQKIKTENTDLKIDAIVPVPDSGRLAALEVAHQLGIPLREGLVKNVATNRTFITAGREQRKKSVKKKLNVIKSEFADKNIMLIDDSIVRGTTARELISLIRTANPRHLYFACASPPIRYPNFYGINIPTRNELLASGKTLEEIAIDLAADKVIYLSLAELTDAVRQANPQIKQFETSCFDGQYPVGNIDETYLQNFEKSQQKASAQPLLRLPII